MKNLKYNKFLQACLTSILVIFSHLSIAAHNSNHVCIQNTPGDHKASDRYIFNDDGTVLDRITNLTWQRCNLGQEWDATTNSCSGATSALAWDSALAQIDEYNIAQNALGNANDWRMPNIKELASIVDTNCVYFAFNDEIFKELHLSYWSSTPIAGSEFETGVYDAATGTTLESYLDEHNVWAVDSYSGKDLMAAQSSLRGVRLVRGGM
jgi:hypothetical protein